jgi:outer membrane lipoprotein-sorting protein
MKDDMELGIGKEDFFKVFFPPLRRQDAKNIFINFYLLAPLRLGGKGKNSMICRQNFVEKLLANLPIPIIYIFSLFILSGINGFSQPGFTRMKNPQQFSKSLAETTQATLTIESKFVQEKNLSVISEKIITQGKFYFKKENRLRWEYTDPFRYLIIMNGDKVLIKDEKKENRFDAASNKVFTEINSIMVGSIRGTILNEKKKFNIDYQESSEFNLVKLIPLSPQLKLFIAEIRILFNKVNFTVSRLEIEEPSGDFTKIEFTGLKINSPVSDEIFSVR